MFFRDFSLGLSRDVIISDCRLVSVQHVLSSMGIGWNQRIEDRSVVYYFLTAFCAHSVPAVKKFLLHSLSKYVIVS